MSLTPETRNSLILRLPNSQDCEAWEEFAEIYQPLIYRLAKQKGLQDSDAHEVTQEVMLAVATAVQRWRPDADRGRFRHWLFRIAKNLVIKYLTRPKYRPIGSGDTAVRDLLNQQPDPGGSQSAQFDTQFDIEYQRELYLRATSQVRQRVSATTWQAFFQTSLRGLDPAVVARQLGLTSGAVYVARSRVRAQLKQAVDRLQRQDPFRQHDDHDPGP